ncbi:PAS domain-containing protein [Streptomyces sp. NA02950]|uniref:hybrid sensor histidine kinase/response regulator n=1 Tax=Streptomyces sp. NA02950 TaxID=2742137 RepID=UPI0015901551|nr:PAS domain-containing protein [Streptomyces sp. NA02950]QKV93918.1 PAS domain-containing protein [Streptomyces sp. NA02950]
MSSRPSRGAARLAAILDALPDALLLVNCNGTVVNANHIALESFEAPGTALVGRGLLDLLPSFDPNRIPGSMRRPTDTERRSGTKPTRMMARRTDGAQFPVEVTSANLEDGRTPYADQYGYTGDELLMLIVRDLTGTLDTEAELARQQRQTEMILRAAAEGVVGVDTEGKVVLVNPSAAQILGYRASDLGGQELHSLVHHSRPDGSPFPYEESPLADTLRSGRKHRVRGQVLWAKDGSQVPVDLTTAPVRDGEQLVGAVMTFTDRRAERDLVAAHTEEVAGLTSQHAEELESLAAKHAAELEELTAQHTQALEDLRAQLAGERERYTEQVESLTARNTQLLAVLDQSLRGPLLELRGELGVLADDPAGQLWPEANQILHHLAAGYTRMTTLVDNVLSYQRMDAGGEEPARRAVSMDEVVAAGVEGAVELIGPGRAQFAVHAPPIEAEVDAERLAQALAHLVADVAGVDSTGKATAGGAAAGDSTIVVAAAQRGNVIRIEVRGPYAGGDPVHEPIVRGIVRRHGGVLQTHEMPGMGGHAYVLEVPISAAAADQERANTASSAGQADGTQGQGTSGGTSGGGTSGGGTPGGGTAGGATSGGGTSGGGTAGDGTGHTPTGRRRARPHPDETPAPGTAAPDTDGSGTQNGEQGAGTAEQPAASGGDTGAHQNEPRPTGRRRARPHPDETPAPGTAAPDTDGSGTGHHRHARADDAPETPGPETAGPEAAGPEAAGPQPVGPAGMGVVPPQGIAAQGQAPGGRRARRGAPAQENSAAPRSALALPPAAADATAPAPQQQVQPGALPALPAARGPEHEQQPPHEQQQAQWGPPPQDTNGGQPQQASTPTGRRRARRALAEAPERPLSDQEQAQGQGQGRPQGQPAEEPGAARGPFALPPAAADRPQEPGGLPPELGPAGLVPAQHGPRGAAQPQGGGGLTVRGEPVPSNGAPGQGGSAMAALPAARGPEHGQQPPHEQQSEPTGRRRARRPLSDEQPGPAAQPPQQNGPPSGQWSGAPARPGSQPLPAEAPPGADTTQGRAISVRTLGQGVPFAQQVGEHGTGQHPTGQHPVGQHPTGQHPTGLQRPGQPQGGRPQGQQPPAQPQSQTPSGGTAATGSGRRRKLAARPEVPGADQGGPARDAAAAAGRTPQPQRAPGPQSSGRAFAIGAPDEGAEGPEPLDGPNGAIEVVDDRTPPLDDELPPEPLDNPRRLLVWPAPDMSTQQALSDRGYRPVIVNSREEVDAQIAAYPAALFVDPLTGPITRTALQSLRTAAVAAEVPVLVTAGLGQATREAAYGADPAVLLKALAPRDSEQHPPRVLLIEEHEPIAAALTATLERRGMQVARAATDADAVTLAGQMRPNLVVMDLMQVRRRRAGIVDWLRGNGLLNRTPLVVYTSADIDPGQLPRLTSGETVLFLAERSTSAEVQARIVDLLAKIGTN